jgi:hypothetical protein
MITLVLVIAGCSSRREPAGCPPDDVIGSIHAAVFWFEHGETDRAREELARAKRAAPRDPTAIEIIRALDDLDPSTDVTGKTEMLRARLADWRCLDDKLHVRLHERLPPIR